MSVLIKDMEMPKSCYACDFSFPSTDSEGGVHTICTALQEEILPLLLERQEDCPLVEVPPHGDLIDRDKIWLNDFEIVMCNGDYKEALQMQTKKILDAPTVIEAEEKE